MTGPEQIAAAFERAATRGRGALAVFLPAGDPDYDVTIELARAAVGAGADIIELGSPFSDPLADGPVIQAAYTRALEGGATTTGAMACAARIASETGAPVVLMVALNAVLSQGVSRYCQQAAAAGVSGLLVPDLPVEDADELREAAATAGLATIFLVGPDSGPDRVAAAAAASTGFVYVLRRRGITGASANRGSGHDIADLRQRVREVRAAAAVPVAVGFGISTYGDAAEMAGIADGVIVGSALVDAAREVWGTTDTDANPAPDRATRRSRAARVVAERVRTLSAALGTRQPKHESPRATAGTGGSA